MNLGAIADLWRRIPIVVRAVMVGFAIGNLGHAPSSNLFFINWKLWPAVPWFAPLAVLWLWFFWQYLSGRWWPQSTSEARRRNLSAPPLSPYVRRWTLIAGGSMMLSSAALHFVAARFDPIDYRGFYKLFRELPPQTLIAFILVISAAAGIVEEAGFRGYMQSMITRRHGPVVATIVVAVFFCLIHVGSIPPLTVTRTIFIFAISVVYSVMVHVSGSIVPGLIIHAVGDAAGVFLLWWLWLLGGPTHGAPLWVYIVESAILAAISVWAFRKVTHSYRSASTGSSRAA